ncbi:MAG: hypothetical protein LBR80_04230 [Deltaproteobacteria bacterium]|nr:hypothetical protein [Deltaproteobacteria bacterium]
MTDKETDGELDVRPCKDMNSWAAVRLTADNVESVKWWIPSWHTVRDLTGTEGGLEIDGEEAFFGNWIAIDCWEEVSLMDDEDFRKRFRLEDKEETA